MLIGEISKETGLSRDTIRFYEKRGLINVEPSNSVFNNYKNYTQAIIERLVLIKKMKSFGFTLNEVAELLDLIDLEKGSCSLFYEKVKEKLLSIDKKIEELKIMKTHIVRRIQDAENICVKTKEKGNCEVIKLINLANNP